MVENSLGEHLENSGEADTCWQNLQRPGVGQIWYYLHSPRSEADSLPGISGGMKHSHGEFRNGSTALRLIALCGN